VSRAPVEPGGKAQIGASPGQVRATQAELAAHAQEPFIGVQRLDRRGLAEPLGRPFSLVRASEGPTADRARQTCPG